ncbi:MAG TPA: hypothetical protein VH592_22070 [Gemmataceae bacterium]|jgi:Zn/Cd-binding protein ZinT
MSKAGKWRKVFPYYKVQTMSEINHCWVDARKAAFDTLEEAKDFIRDQMASKPSRILVVEAKTRRVLEE